MKRFILVFLIAVMALTAVACGSNTVSNSSSESSVLSESTPIGSSGEELPAGGDEERPLAYKYTDRLTTVDGFWSDYILEKTGKDIGALWKSEWRTENGAPFSLIEIINELDIPKSEFVKKNNDDIDRLRAAGSDVFPEEVIFRDYCFTDEEIDIIYSGDKKRIAAAFANPYAVIADDGEVYPLRWVINNAVSLYKERHISVDALEKAVNGILGSSNNISDSDRSALLARVEEYKKLK